MYTKCQLVCNNPDVELDVVLDYIKENHTQDVTVIDLSESLEESTEDSLYLLYLCDDGIKKFFTHYFNTDVAIGIISNEKCPHAINSYNLSTDTNDAIDDAFDESLLTQIDIIQCNESMVFSDVIIGDMHGMNHYDFTSASLFGKIKIFWKNLSNIKFEIYHLTLPEDKKVKTVAAGITVLEQSFSGVQSKFDEALPIHDGKLDALILAPTSLIAYLWYLFAMFITKKVSLLSLPKGLGYIQTTQLSISSSRPIEFMIDNSLVCAQEIELIVLTDALKLHLGRSVAKSVEEEKDTSTDTNDIVNLKTLPQEELGEILISGSLPFFKRATEEEFKELFTGLRTSSRLSSIFLTLTIISSLIATTGLFSNSASVIIGAMILAPLMAPIVSLAMGTIRGDLSLMQHSAKSLVVGIFVSILFSFLLTLVIPLSEVTPEMMSRLHPNFLDLMIALFSGIAGAYATAKEEVAKSLAGVAIAVALVPPLSVTGVGFGMGDLEMVYGSFLLFITNLIGITLSASLTFVILGYSPVRKAKKPIIYTTIMAVLISIPLLLSFETLIEKNSLVNQLELLKYTKIHKKDLELKVIELHEEGDRISLELNVVTTESLLKNDLQALKNKIETSLNKKIVLKINQELIVK